MVLALTLLAMGGAYAYYQHKGEVYRTSTKLYIAQEGDPLLGLGSGFSDDRAVENQATLLTSGDVAAVVARKIGFRGPPSALAGKVKATPSTGADFITITATGATGAEAARIANGFAQAFIEVRSTARRASIQKALAQLHRQLKGVPGGTAGAATREQISGNIRQLEVANNTSAGNARQIDPARPPTSVAGRPVWEKTVFAGLATLLGSILLAYSLHRLDPRLRRVDEAADLYHRPIMASIPHDGEIEYFADGQPAMSVRAKEAFRQLRVNLDLAAIDQPYRLILVTSAGPGEGKSTMARNLALALNEAGRRVALVDADLRKPALPAMLRSDPADGITTVLAGQRSLEDVMVSLTVKSQGVSALGTVTHSDGSAVSGGNGDGTDAITLVGAGPTPPNPPAVLESSAFTALLDDIAARHDVVVIDSAPLAEVSDTVPLLSRADATLIVARSGVTDRRKARRAAAVIERVPGVNLVGVVVNDLGGTEVAAYGAGYGYGYGESGRASKRRAKASGAPQA